MNFAQMHDAGAWLGAAPGFHSAATYTAGGTMTEINGMVFDRQATQTAAQAASHQNRFQSATMIARATATLASGETVSVAANFQDSPNNSDWTDYGDALASTVVISAAGGAVAAKSAAIKHTVDLANAARYIRVQVTPAFSRAGTDTGLFSGVIVLGGPEMLPTDAVSSREP